MYIEKLFAHFVFSSSRIKGRKRENLARKKKQQIQKKVARRRCVAVRGNTTFYSIPSIRGRILVDNGVNRTGEIRGFDDDATVRVLVSDRRRRRRIFPTLHHQLSSPL